MTTTPEQDRRIEQDRQMRQLLFRHLTEFKVEQWLGGSKRKVDRPTRAELESCGYRVVKDPSPRPGDHRLCATTGHVASGRCPNCGATFNEPA